MNKKKQQKKKFIPVKKKTTAEKFISSPLSNSAVFNSRWMLPLFSVGLLIILFTIRKIANLDTGFHLAAGRWILTNFSVPVKDIFTYTVSENAYIDIQWLYQVVVYAFYSIFNYIGLTIFNSLILLSVFYLLMKKMNLSGVPVFLSLILLTIAAVSIQLRFGYRPEIVTWLFILCVLLILERYYYFNQAKLFLLPVIMLLWVNMHGLFIIGLLMIGAFMISIYIEKKVFDKNLFKWFLISTAAVFINPYFTEGALFPFYLFTRLQKGNIFQQNILELQSPWSMTENPGFELYLYYIISFLSLILITITFRKRAFHQFALLAAFFYISYSSFRNIPIFIIYAVYIIAVCLADIFSSEKFKTLIDKAGRFENAFKIAFSVILLLLGIRIVTGAYYLNYNSEIKFGTGVDKTILPVQTASFIDENAVNGKMINNLETGGWLDWSTKVPVFIDGRLEVMKEDFYKEYLSSFSANGLKNLSEKYNADLVINNISNYSWTEQLNKLQGWQLIHWDQNASVYSKSANVNFHFNSAFESVKIDTNKFTDSFKDNLISMGHIENFNDWISGFYTIKNKPVELMKMGNFSFDNSQYRSAEIYYLSFIERSKGSIDELNYTDVYSNLGSVYYLLNDFKRSVVCYEKYLQVRSDNNVKNRVNELKGRLKTN